MNFSIKEDVKGFNCFWVQKVTPIFASIRLQKLGLKAGQIKEDLSEFG